jgi:hypothetical protein
VKRRRPILKGKSRLVQVLVALCMAVGLSADLPAQSQVPGAAAPAASVAGKVVDSRTGQGLANAEVFLVYSGNRGTKERLVAKGMTDSDGRYEFANSITWPT